MRNERHRSSKIHAELSRRSFVLALLDHRIPTYQSFFFSFFFLSASERLSLSLSLFPLQRYRDRGFDSFTIRRSSFAYRDLRSTIIFRREGRMQLGYDSIARRDSALNL